MEQAGQHANRQPVTNVVSICGVLFERSTNALESDFVHWNAATGTLQLGTEDCRILLRALFETYSEQATDPRATDLDPVFLHSSLRHLEATMPERATELGLVASGYLRFLLDTGQWSGDPLSYEAALAAVSSSRLPAPAEEFEDPAGYEIRIPELPADQLDAALLDSSFARHFTDMARFIAPGRDVTSTLVLRLRDVPEAAACVGLRARLVGRSIELPATPRFPERRVGSMGAIDELMRVWELFRDLPLLRQSRTSVRCNPDGMLLIDGPPADRAQLLRTIATAYFQKSISGEHLLILSDMISPFLLEVLLGAASTDPPLAIDVWNGDFALPGVPSIPSAFLAQLLREELLRIQADGLVDVGEFITVPWHLRQCLSDALEGLISEETTQWGRPGSTAPLWLVTAPGTSSV
ncbi:hypothetical protein [Paeniglutamicibacter cryotolerans]|uniref:Uncharacterized protein n=1 Tax=Paeniglutamicibacter cryotolerans TaxID=670079 RepID=A0A839QMM8_9MICC|nr:hypothetical protein [Paeniglutamicibacter cryotolerans]MBB2995256.1 hypothetical protein [Paeniglutamicibacter cryotolerans]